jgi:hypothetical protein
VLVAGLDDLVEHFEDGRAERLAEVGHFWIIPVRRHQVLRQVVRADADKVHLIQQMIDAQGRRRHLEHDSQGHILGERDLGALERQARPVDHALELPNFLQRADHREQQSAPAVEPGAKDGPHLRLKEFGVSDAEADAAPAHERVGLARVSEIGHLLVASQVERANRHVLIGGRFDNLAVDGQLLFFGRYRGVRQEKIFRAVEADSPRAHFGRHR